MDEETVLATTPIHKVAALAHALSVSIEVDGLSAIGLASRLDIGDGNARRDYPGAIDFRITDLGRVAHTLAISTVTHNRA